MGIVFVQCCRTAIHSCAWALEGNKS